LLMQNAPLRDAMGRNGKAYVNQNYKWTTILSKYERMFTRLRPDGREPERRPERERPRESRDRTPEPRRDRPRNGGEGRRDRGRSGDRSGRGPRARR